MRDKGVAGAGGESASQGESRYCNAVDNLDFDQLIWEYYNGDEPVWLHVSYKSKKDNRKQVLVIKKRGVYHTWQDCKDCE